MEWTTRSRDTRIPPRASSRWPNYGKRGLPVYTVESHAAIRNCVTHVSFCVYGTARGWAKRRAPDGGREKARLVGLVPSVAACLGLSDNQIYCRGCIEDIAESRLDVLRVCGAEQIQCAGRKRTRVALAGKRHAGTPTRGLLRVCGRASTSRTHSRGQTACPPRPRRGHAGGRRHLAR